MCPSSPQVKWISQFIILLLFDPILYGITVSILVSVCVCVLVYVMVCVIQVIGSFEDPQAPPYDPRSPGNLDGYVCVCPSVR